MVAKNSGGVRSKSVYGDLRASLNKMDPEQQKQSEWGEK